jgi:hypothetical protein
MKSASLVLLLFGCLISCQTKKPTAGLNATIFIDLGEAVALQLPPEEWIEEVLFIPLETNSVCYLPSLTRYNLNKDFIVVYADQSIHLFERDGKHLNSFSHWGKGPGEYSNLYSVDLIPDRKEIMGVDQSRRKILCYDFDGNLTNEIRTATMPVRAVSLDGGLFAYYLSRLKGTGQLGPDFHLVEIINGEGVTISKHLPYQFQLDREGATFISNSGENGIYFINPCFSYNIYQIGPENQFFRKYSFSFGDYNIDTTLLSNEKHESGADLQAAFCNKKKNLDFLVVTTNTISFWAPVNRTKMQFGTRQINRKTGHVRFVEVDSSNNSINYSGIPFEFPKKSSGDYFVLSMDAINLLEIVRKLTTEQKKFLAKCEGFERLAALKEDDNPVLILYKVRDF